MEVATATDILAMVSVALMYARFFFVLGAVLRLGDDVFGLGVSGGDDARTLLFGVAASLENDLGSLATGLGDDAHRLLANLGRLGLGGVSLLEAVLDLVLTGIQNGNDLRPDKLGQQEPDDQEDDECRNELGHLGDQDIRAT